MCDGSFGRPVSKAASVDAGAGSFGDADVVAEGSFGRLISMVSQQIDVRQKADRRQMQLQICRMYDVPPWVALAWYPKPKFARCRWALRRWWPL